MSENALSNNYSGHNVLIYSRGETFTITGISTVISFDETMIVVDVCGLLLTVEGQNISIVDVDTEKGSLIASGLVNAIYYSQNKHTEKSMFSRLMGR